MVDDVLEEFIDDVVRSGLDRVEVGLGLTPGMEGTPGLEIIATGAQAPTLGHEQSTSTGARTGLTGFVLLAPDVLPLGRGRLDVAQVVARDRRTGLDPVVTQETSAKLDGVVTQDARSSRVVDEDEVFIGPEGQGAARSHDPAEFDEETVVLKPVGGLGGDDQVDRVVAQPGETLGGAHVIVDVGMGRRRRHRSCLCDHLGRDVDADDALEGRRQRPSDQSGSTSEVDAERS